jgi:predicted PurR-regulated permease PerM
MAQAALPAIRFRRIARIIFTLAILALGLWIAKDFLLPVAWAVIIAVALWPLYDRLVKFMPKRVRALLGPLLFTMAICLVLIIPLMFAAVQLASEAQNAIEWLARVQENGIPPPSWLARIPIGSRWAVSWWQAHLSDPRAAGDLLGSIDANTVTMPIRKFVPQLLQRVALFFFVLLTLFFVFRDGEGLGRRFLALVDQWLGDPGERVAENLAGVIRGTVNGTVLVALGEGTLIGIGYFVTGVPQPVLFAVPTVAFALLPFGAWLVFGVAALVLLLQGSGLLAAGGLFAFGAAVMLIGDNLVQPKLIGEAGRLPLLIALISIFGGMRTFGLIGLFLGPVIMSVLLTIWREWIDPPGSELP